MFDKVLIANRGEIACRVIATCRRVGIATVAVYSDADAGARHVRLADEAVHIGAAPAASSYLDIARIVAAAHATQAQAIHPGYGFLAENADFAQACEDAGLAFIGPAPATIAAMGSKAAAKQRMQTAGVPVIPGYHGDDQSDAALTAAAGDMGFPLLVKASAGGGGKGMRIVRAAAELTRAIAAARRESVSAFGDGRLILERYLEKPRHIEFQVFGDRHGNLVHLYERECSIQRRYQKIIEESPSPYLDEALRASMGAAAVEAARAVDYHNAGTVEFIVDAQRQFYFLEMNTRLQVEHPVTEKVTGLDLVEWQLRIAAGEPLPASQEQIGLSGHAIEARIYAEDPGQGFIPSTGRVRRFAHPGDEPGVRLDSGYDDGDEVSIHYDPLIAKLICDGEDRGVALARLRFALAHTALFGPTTNLALLRSIASNPVFAAGEADTAYIDQHIDALVTPPAPDELVYCVAAAAEMLARERRSGFARSPWDIDDGWQANGLTRNRLVLAAPGHTQRTFDVAGRHGRYIVRGAGDAQTVSARQSGAERLMIETPATSAAAGVIRQGDDIQIVIGDRATRLQFLDPYPAAAATVDAAAHPGSPMPGRIVAVHVSAGDSVEKGQPLIVLEGMKMEFTVTARTGGTVQRVLYREGDMVESEVPLVDIEPH